MRMHTYRYHDTAFGAAGDGTAVKWNGMNGGEDAGKYFVGVNVTRTRRTFLVYNPEYFSSMFLCDGSCCCFLVGWARMIAITNARA